MSAAGEHEEMAAGVHSVIAAAERAADAIRADAEQRAAELLREAQERADRFTAERLGVVSGLTDELIAQAGAVREQTQRLLATLGEAIEATEGRVAELTGGEAPGAEASVEAATEAGPPAA